MEFKRGKGITRDFSVSGVFFETEQSFSTEDPIEFFLILEHIDPGPQVRVNCLGEVVRVESMGQKTGVAAAIKSYRFEGAGHRPFKAWGLEGLGKNNSI